jgi:hypothetical protein
VEDRDEEQGPTTHGASCRSVDLVPEPKVSYSEYEGDRRNAKGSNGDCRDNAHTRFPENRIADVKGKRQSQANISTPPRKSLERRTSFSSVRRCEAINSAFLDGFCSGLLIDDPMAGADADHSEGSGTDLLKQP